MRNLSPVPEFRSTDTDRPRYDFVTDCITIPDMKYFETSQQYYCTLFHELTHWTGPASRLGRIGITDIKATFGSKLYAEEELVAELGANFLCVFTGIDQEQLTKNNAAYIQSWLKQLRNDKKYIFRAAARAQEAVDYLYKSDRK